MKVFSHQSTAKRLRKHDGAAMVSELVVVCLECGERFSIAKEVPCVDQPRVTRLTHWLLDKLVWDHIQENKHPGSILLPESEELARWVRRNREG